MCEIFQMFLENIAFAFYIFPLIRAILRLEQIEQRNLLKKVKYDKVAISRGPPTELIGVDSRIADHGEIARKSTCIFDNF